MKSIAFASLQIVNNREITKEAALPESIVFVLNNVFFPK